MSGIMGGLLSSYGAELPATLVYNLDATALGARPGSSITTSSSFNGSTQNLAIAANSALTLGTSDHTVEFWMNQTSRGTFDVPWAYDGTAAQFASNYYILIVGSSSFSLNLGDGAGGWSFILDCGAAPSLSAWHHYAVVRNGSTFTVYVDGTSVASTTSSQTISAQANPMFVGYHSANGRITGNVSNLRMVVGTALYTTTFTPPTTTLRAVTGTQLLLPLTGAPFMDVSSNLLAVTNTGTITTTTAAPALTTGTTDVTGTYTITSSLPVATFTGSCASTTLTVASGLTGTVTTGMTITGGAIPAGTYIVNQLTGTTGSTGTYTISAGVTQSSTSIVGARINWFGTQGGIFSNYFSGDGIGAYITGGPNIGAATKYTVMVAYKLNTGAAGAYGRLLNSNTGTPDWLAGGYSGIPKVWYSNGQTINLSGTADTVWHIDFLTFNKATGNLYSSTSAQPTTPAYTLASSSISGFDQLKLYSKSDGNECAAGDIGVVKVWTGVLSLAQIQAQYAAYKARFGY